MSIDNDERRPTVRRSRTSGENAEPIDYTPKGAMSMVDQTTIDYFRSQNASLPFTDPKGYYDWLTGGGTVGPSSNPAQDKSQYYYPTSGDPSKLVNQPLSYDQAAPWWKGGADQAWMLPLIIAAYGTLAGGAPTGAEAAAEGAAVESAAPAASSEFALVPEGSSAGIGGVGKSGVGLTAPGAGGVASGAGSAAGSSVLGANEFALVPEGARVGIGGVGKAGLGLVPPIAGAAPGGQGLVFPGFDAGGIAGAEMLAPALSNPLTYSAGSALTQAAKAANGVPKAAGETLSKGGGLLDMLSKIAPLASLALGLAGAAKLAGAAGDGGQSQAASLPMPSEPPASLAAQVGTQNMFKAIRGAGGALGSNDPTALTGPGGIHNRYLSLGKPTVLGM